MTHDSLCRYDEIEYACMCPLIARVRADERQTCVSIVQTVGADHQYNAGRNTWRNEALVKLGFTGHI
jgi:hypothetical protein